MNEYLPVGSVVRLKNGQKKLVIMGILQVKEENQKVFDYLGVPYPEGFLGTETAALFDHENIEEICFLGYDDEERGRMLQVLSEMQEAAERAIREGVEAETGETKNG